MHLPVQLCHLLSTEVPPISRVAGTQLEPIPVCRYEPIRAALTGLIFDSGPCVMTAQSGRTSLSSGTAFPMKQLLEAVFLVILALTFLLAGNTPKRFW